MTYPGLLAEFASLADEKYRAFHAKILADPQIALFGVRVPHLRNLAKKYGDEWETLASFPDEYYETTFLKCLVLGQQPYPVFCEYLPKILPHIDNWAVCDCFSAPCIVQNRADFIRILERYRFSPHAFTSRWCLVELLRDYCEEEYLPFLFESIAGCDHSRYYVSMAAAWLLAEVLVRHYEKGVAFLRTGALPAQTQRRAIRKACESFRLSEERKTELKTLKN